MHLMDKSYTKPHARPKQVKDICYETSKGEAVDCRGCGAEFSSAFVRINDCHLALVSAGPLI